MNKKIITLSALTALALSSTIVSASPISSESWLQNSNTVVTERNNEITKNYRINKDIDVTYYDINGNNAGSIKSFTDHNPTSYQKLTVGNHTIESWMSNGTAYTKDNDKIVKTYTVNNNLETVQYDVSSSNAGSIKQVIDHNPSLRQSTTLLGHTANSWLDGNTVRSTVDNKAAKSYTINQDVETIRYASSAGDNAGSIKMAIDHNPSLHQTLTIG